MEVNVKDYGLGGFALYYTYLLIKEKYGKIWDDLVQYSWLVYTNNKDPRYFSKHPFRPYFLDLLVRFSADSKIIGPTKN